MIFNPCSPNQIEAATTLLVAKTADAIRDCHGDLDKANSLMWQWCQNDEALKDAILRIMFAQNVVKLTISGCAQGAADHLTKVVPFSRRCRS